MPRYVQAVKPIGNRQHDPDISQYVTRFLKTGKVDVGYAAHPSLITHEELGAIQGPFSITAARKCS